VAEGLKKRVAKLDREYVQAGLKRQFVERSVVFLGRLEQFLEALPDSADGERIYAYLKQVEEYVTQLERTITAFREFTGRVGEFEGSTPTPAEPLTAYPVPHDHVTTTTPHAYPVTTEGGRGRQTIQSGIRYYQRTAVAR
jgi:hypothetical protein